MFEYCIYSAVLCIILLCVLQGLTDMYMWINMITHNSLPRTPHSSPWSKYLYNNYYSSCERHTIYSSLHSSPPRSGSQSSDYSLHTPVSPLTKLKPPSSAKYGQNPSNTHTPPRHSYTNLTPPRHTPTMYTLQRPDLIQLSSSRAKGRQEDCRGVDPEVKGTYSAYNSIVENDISDSDNMNDDYSLLCDELLENDDSDNKTDDSDLNYKSNKHLSCVNIHDMGAGWLGGNEEILAENKDNTGQMKSNDEYFNYLILMIENATKDLQFE